MRAQTAMSCGNHDDIIVCAIMQNDLTSKSCRDNYVTLYLTASISISFFNDLLFHDT